MIKYLILTSWLTGLGYSAINSEGSVVVISEYNLETQRNKVEETEFIGTWYFLSKENDTKSKAENLNEGKAIIIKEDFKFESDVFSEKELGTWNFDKRKQLLKFNFTSYSTEWEVKNLNEFGVVLINVKTKDKWIFAAAY